MNSLAMAWRTRNRSMRRRSPSEGALAALRVNAVGALLPAGIGHELGRRLAGRWRPSAVSSLPTAARRTRCRRRSRGRSRRCSTELFRRSMAQLMALRTSSWHVSASPAENAPSVPVFSAPGATAGSETPRAAAGRAAQQLVALGRLVGERRGRARRMSTLPDCTAASAASSSMNSIVRRSILGASPEQSGFAPGSMYLAARSIPLLEHVAPRAYGDLSP